MKEENEIKKGRWRSFLVVQWLRLCTFNHLWFWNSDLTSSVARKLKGAGEWRLFELGGQKSPL